MSGELTFSRHRRGRGKGCVCVRVFACVSVHAWLCVCVCWCWGQCCCCSKRFRVGSFSALGDWGLLGCKSKLTALLTSPSRWEGLFYSMARGWFWADRPQLALDLWASSDSLVIFHRFAYYRQIGVSSSHYWNGHATRCQKMMQSCPWKSALTCAAEQFLFCFTLKQTQTSDPFLSLFFGLSLLFFMANDGIASRPASSVSCQ